jgi:PAS domain S-box-containing protein
MLELEDHKFKYFFDLSPDLMCIAGYDGYFKRINPAVSNLLGYTESELFSKPINEFVHPEDKLITSQVRKELTKRNPLHYFENRYITSNGDVVWLSWTSLPVESEQLIFAVAKNITHKKFLEHERNDHLLKLTNVNKDLKELTYSATHDLRSPVTNLMAIFEMMNLANIKDQETLEYLSIMKDSLERLKNTLENYIDGLIQKDSVPIQTDIVPFQYSLDRVVYSISSLITDTKTTIETDFSELEFVIFNFSYMESILLNLITNAIKYSKPGSHPKISIRSKINGDKKQLLVSDNGVGFDLPKIKDKIFGLHQKFNDRSDSKGVGLYLVHSHIKNLGGEIQIESKLHEGSTFTMTFKD